MLLSIFHLRHGRNILARPLLAGAAATVSAVGAGLLVPLAPGVALSVVVLVVAVATLATRAWVAVTWFVLTGLIILSSGFNNIPLPLPGANIPLVDALLVYALVASRPHWLPFVGTSLGRRVLLLLVLLSVFAVPRLVVDVPRHGLLAGRDALYVLEAWGVLVGYAVARATGVRGTERGLAILWRVAIIWFLLFPAREMLAHLGPTVGIQRPTPLIAFTTIGFIGATALFWFLRERRADSVVFASLALLVVLMAQGRAIYLAIPLAGVVIWFIGRFSASSEHVPGRHLMTVAAALALGFVLLATLPPLPGRVGEQVSLDAVAIQISTLSGAEGPGAGSFRHRAQAWPEVVRTVSAEPAGPIIGIGYGPDLFGGFTIASGVQIRKPHNDPLEIWGRTGLVGVVPWLGLLAILAIWALRIAPRHPYGWWLIGLQSATFALALTQPFFGFAYGGLVYTLLMGIAIGIADANRSKTTDTMPSMTTPEQDHS